MLGKQLPFKVLLILLYLTGIAVADEVLSVEFLDYLAEFENDEGEWVDPLELEMMSQLDPSLMEQREGHHDE